MTYASPNNKIKFILIDNNKFMIDYADTVTKDMIMITKHVESISEVLNICLLLYITIDDISVIYVMVAWEGFDLLSSSLAIDL